MKDQKRCAVVYAWDPCIAVLDSYWLMVNDKIKDRPSQVNFDADKVPARRVLK